MAIANASAAATTAVFASTGRYVLELHALDAAEKDGLTHWRVTISDEATAEQHLLRLILQDPAVIVTSFGRKTYNLEEVFLNLVEGSEKNGR